MPDIPVGHVLFYIASSLRLLPDGMFPSFASNARSCIMMNERTDPAANARRYYQVSWEPTLLDDGAVVRTYGRKGRWKRVAITPFLSLDLAVHPGDDPDAPAARISGIIRCEQSPIQRRKTPHRVCSDLFVLLYGFAVRDCLSFDLTRAKETGVSGFFGVVTAIDIGDVPPRACALTTRRSHLYNVDRLGGLTDGNR